MTSPVLWLQLSGPGPVEAYYGSTSESFLHYQIHSSFLLRLPRPPQLIAPIPPFLPRHNLALPFIFSLPVLVIFVSKHRNR